MNFLKKTKKKTFKASTLNVGKINKSNKVSCRTHIRRANLLKKQIINSKMKEKCPLKRKKN